MSDANYKGDWMLGTACGSCPRCRETVLAAAVKLQDEIRDRLRPRPLAYEIEASLVDEVARLAQEVAEDLIAEMDAKYIGREKYDVQKRRHARDSQPARDLMSALDRLPVRADKGNGS